MNDTSRDTQGQTRTPDPAPVPAPDPAGRNASGPREISREEMDRQQPADADPDDPVSP